MYNCIPVSTRNRFRVLQDEVREALWAASANPRTPEYGKEWIHGPWKVIPPVLTP